METGESWTAVIIEDDPDVRDLIDIVLTQSGFRTVLAADGPSGLDAVREHQPLLTTLDVNMPGMDGFAVAKRMRDFSSTYLIMITALADEIDVVTGFEAGADDYLVKPFRPRELRARADSMLRRPRGRVQAAVPPPAPEPAPGPAQAPAQATWVDTAAQGLRAEPVPPLGAPTPQTIPGTIPQAVPPLQPAAGPTVVAVPPQPPNALPVVPAAPVAPAAGVPPVTLHAVPFQPVPPVPPEAGGPAADGAWIHFNGLALNYETRVVTVDNRGIDLTRTEFDLLASLLSTGRRVRSKADLVLTMRGQQYVTSYFVNEADKRSVEVHIANLRRKIGDDSSSPRFIETVRGVGYRLASPR
ncbi:hypothetical protein GCM10022215_11490 [Nocardioides fonticola]|uniref:Response regulator transcription factor n=1 Tax=Nocardioides fonticola TaxID=450363 RepID=A0ABP7XFF2_9ACTN